MVNDRSGDVGALRQALLYAGEEKLRGIVAILDEAGDPRINATILDPVRPRLALIRPPRPLKFPRVLFIPLDPLIVPARAWREGRPAVPRSVLPCLAQLVHAGLGAVAPRVEALIADRSRDPEAMVDEAGALLWPEAAAVLDRTAAPPPDWEETGMRPDVFQPLIRAIAAVLRRGPALRALAEDAAASDPGPDAPRVDGLLENMSGEPELGHAMIVRILLKRAPRAADSLWRMVNAAWSAADRATLRKAMANGREEVLTDLETESGFASEIGRISLVAAGMETRRTVALLSVLADDPMSVRDRPRVEAIRKTVNEACRARLASGIEDELAAPLAAAVGEVDAACQIRLETNARAFRHLELAARPIGRSVDYDRLIDQAVTVVRDAVDTLSLVRQCRLIEILAGSEAAAALYDSAGPFNGGAGLAPGRPERPADPHQGLSA